jgi:hypothetical protein
MKKTIYMLTVFLMFGLVCLPATSIKADAAVNAEMTMQGDQDFTVVNKTGIEIYALYVARHNEDDWGEDILGRDTLPNGESLEIEFNRKEKTKYWDLRIEDKKGGYIEWEKLNLLEISTVTLFYKNGKASAIVE